jgi:sarcosine oxidase subunit gamma
LDWTSVWKKNLCIIDSEGKTVREVKVSTEPEAIRSALEGYADDSALGARIHDAFGIVLPSEPRRVSNGVEAFTGIAPGVWLATFEKAGPLMASELASSLAGLASVADQTSAYAVLRFTGDVAREVLPRGAFIDFDPSVFGPGSAAVTTISHIGVLIWQIDDAPTFEVALFRSCADSF